MALRADVNRLMGGELGSWLDAQADMRARAKEKAWNRWTWGGALALPVLAFLWFAPILGLDWKFMLSAAAIGGVYAWGYQPIQEAKKTIKIGINSAIARDLGIFYEHDVDPGSEWRAACNYGLVPKCDRDSFEDKWFGQLEGHDFLLYEAHLEERRGSGRNRRWVTVFRGAIIAMQFGRQFHSTTLLHRKGKHKKWFGLGGRKDVVSFGGHQLDYVDQVLPEFDDVFEVYTDDQVEARVLVHPSYIEHLLAIERAFKGDAVRALFSKGEVLIAVESGDLFESGHIDAFGDHERTKEAAEQFGSLAELALAINQTDRGQTVNTRRRRTRDAMPSEPAPQPGPGGLGAGRHVGFGRKGL